MDGTQTRDGLSSSMSTPIARSHPVVTFYVLAFAISWTGFSPVLARMWGLPGFQSPLWLGALILPAVGPAVAAGIASRLAGDAGTAWTRLRNGFGMRVAWRWWVLAVLLPVGTVLASEGLSRLLLPGRPAAMAPITGVGLLLVCAMSIGANPWEEVGWRGFALTRLQAQYGMNVAATIVGVLWALWHIPLFIWNGSPMSTFPFWTWAAGLMGQSFVRAWLYNRAGRSLGVVTVCHVALNVVGALVGERSHVVFSAVEILTAVVCVLFFPAHGWPKLPPIAVTDPDEVWQISHPPPAPHNLTK
jgi:membrane protease YdiL (CAAX protease family)